MITLTAIGLFGTAIAVIGVIGSGETAFTLFQLTMRLPVYFKVDAVGRLFVSVVTIVWVLAGIYAFRYMQHEDCNKTLIKITERIDMEKVFEIIDNTETITEIQNTFYKIMLSERKKRILDFAVDKIKGTIL